MIIKKGELPTRVDLIGREVVCRRSWFYGYKVGKVYKVGGGGDALCRYIRLTGGFNGNCGEWEVIEEELDVKDFL